MPPPLVTSLLVAGGQYPAHVRLDVNLAGEVPSQEIVGAGLSSGHLNDTGVVHPAILPDKVLKCVWIRQADSILHEISIALRGLGESE